MVEEGVRSLVMVVMVAVEEEDGRDWEEEDGVGSRGEEF